MASQRHGPKVPRTLRRPPDAWRAGAMPGDRDDGLSPAPKKRHRQADPPQRKHGQPHFRPARTTSKCSKTAQTGLHIACVEGVGKDTRKGRGAGPAIAKCNERAMDFLS